MEKTFSSTSLKNILIIYFISPDSIYKDFVSLYGNLHFFLIRGIWMPLLAREVNGKDWRILLTKLDLICTWCSLNRLVGYFELFSTSFICQFHFMHGYRFNCPTNLSS